MRTVFALSILLSDCGGSSSGAGSSTGGTTQQTPSPTYNPSNPVCGDGVCQASEEESCNACPADCNTRAVVCGNGECQGGENEATCYADCGPDDWYADWVTMEEQTFALINATRAAGGTCPGGESFGPAPALVLDADLREAARLHSWDTGYNDYLSHPSCNGHTPWNRAQDQGAQWSAENLGRGYSSAQSVVNAWLNSDGHCRMLFSATRSHGAVGYAKPMNQNSTWSFEAW